MQYYCRNCRETFSEPGNWNANMKSFLCINCFSPLIKVKTQVNKDQEEKVLNLCREWYRTGKDITKQTLWYEIGVMLENEP